MKSLVLFVLSFPLALSLGLGQFDTAQAAPQSSAAPIYRRFDIALSTETKKSGEVSDFERAKLNERMQDATGAVKLTGFKEAIALIGTRGQSSIKAPRKNFSVDIQGCGKKGPLPGYEIAGKPVCKLILTSMWQDRGYISTKIGLEFMRTFNVSEVLSEYVELFVNGESRGLYLMSEDPKNKIKKEIKATWISKRKGSINFDKLKEGQYDGIGQIDIEYDSEEAPCKNCEAQYFSIRKILRRAIINSLRGKALEAELRKVVDLDQMMTFMAVNRWLRNGDYADEFYMYQTEPNTPFQIFGWDYDDLFKPVHFLSRTPLRAIFHDSMNYSSEASIFLVFAADHYLKNLFHKKLYDLLSSSSVEKVDQIMGSIAAGLTPYLDAKKSTSATPQMIEAMSKLDDQKITEGNSYTPDYLAQNWQGRRAEILTERLKILGELKKEGFGRK